MRFSPLLAPGLALLLAFPVAAQDRPTPAPRSSDDAPMTLREMYDARSPRAANPDQALRELMLGNVRFFDGRTPDDRFSAADRRAFIYGQQPFATILSCSDSRAPAEMIFDQRIGDIFGVRLAGNVVTPESIGSLEYAVDNLRSSIVVVMGHEGCGAVTAALAPARDRNALPPDLQTLLNRIVPAVRNTPELSDESARTRVAVIENIRHQMREIERNPVMAQAVREGRIKIVGAYYEVRSGAVEFLDSSSAEAR